jgi:hypothetical protein
MISFTKKITAASIGCALLAFSPVLAHENSDQAEVAKEEKVKPKKITDRRHPDYIRCRSQPIIGSLARKRRVCMTNSQWVAANREGSRKSRQYIEDMQVGSNTSN